MKPAAVQLIRAAFGSDGDGCDCAILGAVVDHGELHLLYGFEAGLRGGNLSAALVAESDSIEDEAVLKTERAAERM